MNTDAKSASTVKKPFNGWFGGTAHDARGTGRGAKKIMGSGVECGVQGGVRGAVQW